MRYLGETETLFIGIDEAGRGPLIGDMVLSCVVVRESVLSKLTELGLRDSKALSPGTRRLLYLSAIRRGVLSISIYLHPRRIDRYNLNDLEVEAIEWIAKTLRIILGKQSSREIRIYVDDVRGREKEIERILRDHLSIRPLLIRVEPGSDSKYPATSLAGIFAKVQRDVSLEKSRRILGDFGSGYPSDPATRKWVMEKYTTLRQPVPMIRITWSCLRDIAPRWYREKKKTRSLLEYTKRW